VLAQDLELVVDGRGIAEPVPQVGVARGEAERLPLAATADQDLRSAGLDRLRHVPGTVHARDQPVDGALWLPEHRQADLQRVLEAVEALGDPREVVAIGVGLRMVPRGPDPQDRPPGRHDVERRHDLRQERRVPIGHARHQRAERDARRPRRQGREHGVRLEHRLALRSDVRDLMVVIHHPERVGASLLRGARDRHDPIEQLGVGNVREREARELEPEVRLRLSRYAAATATVVRWIAPRPPAG
jgi:hypothetical protein